MKRVRDLASVVALLIILAPSASAQQPAGCDSTVMVDRELAVEAAIPAELREWIAFASKIELLPDRPAPTNQHVVGRELVRSYPRELRDHGVGGEVTFAVLVDSTGKVKARRLMRSSGYVQLDRAAHPVVSRIRYEPVRLEQGCAVPMVLRVPIVYRSFP